MITYAWTLSFPMLLLVTAVVVAAICRGPVAARGLTPLNAPRRLLAGF
jgi:hypothetical protein